jgi:chromosome segregation ATPase
VNDDWSEQRRRLIEDTKIRRLTLELPEDVYERARALQEGTGRSEQQTLLSIFLNGLAYLEGQAVVDRLQRGDVPEAVAEELSKTLTQFMEASSAYAAMRFKAFRLSQDNEALEMREAGLRAENAFLRRRLDLFREDEERLKEALAAQEAELAQLRQRLAESPSSPETERGQAAPRPKGLRTLFGRWRHGASPSDQH